MPDAPLSTFMEDEYVFQWPAMDVQLTIERFREDKGDLRADCQPQSVNSSGSLPNEKLNLNSARSLRMYANTLGGYMFEADTWFELLTQACQLAVQRYRNGAPAVRLSEVEFHDRPRFLVYPFVEAGVRSLLFGDGGASKSMHALALAASVSTGVAIIPGTRVHATGSVLYLDWEDEPETHAERLAAICKGANIDVPDNIMYMRRTGSLHESTREIRRQIASSGAIFAVVDSVGAACGGDPERAADVIRTFDGMRSLEIPVLAIHHVPKDAKDKTKPFGSVYAPNLSRLMWRLDREDGQQGEAFIRGSHHKGNNVGSLSFVGHRIVFETDGQYQLTSVLFTAAGALPSTGLSVSSDSAIRYKIAALLRDAGNDQALSVADISESLGISPGVARTQLNRYKDWFTHGEDNLWSLIPGTDHDSEGRPEAAEEAELDLPF